MGKPAFDPNKAFEPVAQNDKPAFDPAKAFEPVAAKPDIGQGNAAMIKASEGATLETRPFIAGLGSAAGEAYNQATNSYPIEYARGSKPQSALSQVLGAFKEGRQNAIDEQNTASEQYPKTALGANIAGTVLTAPLMPAAAGLKGAMKAGALMGAGHAAGNASSVAEGVQDVGTGMAGGAAGHVLASTVGSATSNALQSMAETKAFKAAGAMLKDFRAAFNRDPEKINELGRTMIDNGLVKAGDTVSSIAEKAQILKRETGKQIGKVYDKVLDTLTNPESNVAPEVAMHIQEMGFHPEMQAEEMKALVAQSLMGQPGSTTAINKANQVINELAANGNNITPDHALDLKGGIDHMINWSKKAQDLPLEQDALKIVRNYIQGRLTSQVQALDQVLGNSQSQELVRLNSLYGNAATIAEVSKDRVARELGHKAFGLTDTIMGAGGMSAGAGAAHALGIHDPAMVGAIAAATGAVAGLGNKLVGKYGTAAMASGLEGAGKIAANPNSYSPAISTTIRSFIGKKGKVSSEREIGPSQILSGE